MLDFGALPPEINSGRIYAGPGAASMLAAATAWQELATELNSVAANYSSIISGLTSGSWSGPTSATMAAAVAPYVTWLSSTGVQAEEAAAHATAAAGAYETALAATVPPPVIAANRSLLAHWWRPIFSVRTARRLRQPKRTTRRCGHRMPPPCTATPAPRRRPRR